MAIPCVGEFSRRAAVCICKTALDLLRSLTAFSALLVLCSALPTRLLQSLLSSLDRHDYINRNTPYETRDSERFDEFVMSKLAKLFQDVLIEYDRRH